MWHKTATICGDTLSVRCKDSVPKQTIHEQNMCGGLNAHNIDISLDAEQARFGQDVFSSHRLAHESILVVFRQLPTQVET